jgi:signal transduction histidine kinase
VVTFFAFHIYRNPHPFILSHTLLFGGVAAAFVIGGIWQINKLLSQFNQLRLQMGEIRSGTRKQMEGSYPSEVQPLVNDLNALIEHNDQSVARAQAKAGDLAHGLKTPLAVLNKEAESARAAGHQELADTITQQVDRMQRQVTYHLAQARASASGSTLGARCAVAESADGLVRTLQRLYADRGLILDSKTPADHVVQAQREDLDEMLGNLLDNACKWAKTRVTIASIVEKDRIAITVDDDGPGLEPAKRDVVLQRGVRADEAAPGSGLGLAIVRDLAEVYRGSIALEASPHGGLRARLVLPKA